MPSRTFIGTFNLHLTPGPSETPTVPIAAVGAVAMMCPWGSASASAKHSVRYVSATHTHQINVGASTADGQSDSASTGIVSGALESVSGSISITCETDLTQGVVALGSALTDPANGFPYEFYNSFFNGIPDGTTGYYIGLGEVIQYGSTITATVSCGGISATATGTVSHHNIGVEEMLGTVSISGSSGPGDLGGGSTGGSISWSGMPLAYNNPFTHSLRGCNISISSSSITATSNEGSSVAAQLAATPPLAYHLQGRVRTVTGAYPNSKDIAIIDHSDYDPSTGHYYDVASIFSANPNVDHTTSTYNWDAYGAIDELTWEDVFFNQPSVCRIWFPSPDQNGDDASDWRLGIFGPKFHSFTVSRVDDLVIDHCSNASHFTAGANTTVTSGGSSVSLAVAGGVGDATAAYAHVPAAQYGVMRIRIRSTVGDNKAFRVTINGSKWWDCTTDVAGTYKDVDVYLCSPWNATGVDGQWTQWPLTMPGGDPQFEGLMWGVNNLDSIKFEHLVDGETYEIDDIKFTTVQTPKLSFLGLNAYPKDIGFQKAWPDQVGDTITTKTWIRPAVWSLCDGRRGVDWYDMALVNISDMTGHSSDTYTWVSLDQYINMFNNITGWSAVSASPSGPFYNNDLQAAWIGGGNGAIYDHGSGSYTSCIDVTPPFNVWCQPVYDQIKGYPDCGAHFGGAAGEIPVVFNKICRSDCDGLMVDQHGAFTAGDNVVMYLTSNHSDVAGNCVGDVNGYYLIVPKGARGPVSWTTQMQALTNPFYAHTLPDRNRARVCFADYHPAPTPGQKDVQNQHDESGYYYRVSVNHTGDVVWNFSFASIPRPTTGFDISTTVTSTGDCSQPCVHHDWTTRRVYLVYLRTDGGGATTTWQTVSDDFGVTWQAPAAFP